METLPTKRGPRLIFILIYVIFGLYFVNYPFQFIKIPAPILGFEQWIILVGGLLILLGAINYYRIKKKAF